MEKKLKNLQTFEQHIDRNLNISDVRSSENINENTFNEGEMSLEILDNQESIIFRISNNNTHSICNNIEFETDKVNIQEIIDSLRGLI